jgi:hypothetical protein
MERPRKSYEPDLKVGHEIKRGQHEHTPDIQYTKPVSNLLNAAYFSRLAKYYEYMMSQTGGEERQKYKRKYWNTRSLELDAKEHEAGAHKAVRIQAKFNAASEPKIRRKAREVKTSKSLFRKAVKPRGVKRDLTATEKKLRISKKNAKK